MSLTKIVFEIETFEMEKYTFPVTRVQVEFFLLKAILKIKNVSFADNHI